MTSRVKLLPYDRMFLASHLAQQRRGLPGHPLLAWLDLRGRPDRVALVSAVRRAMALVPTTAAKIRHSLVTARAHWQLNGTHLDPVALEYHDLRGVPDPERVQHELLRSTFRQPLDPCVSPQMRLLHVQLEDDRHRLLMHWPHYLMDLEGARMFLMTMGLPESLDEGPAHDNGMADEYPPTWSRRYVRRWAQGMRRSRELSRVQSTVFRNNGPTETDGADLLTRSWSPAMAQHIAQAARRTCAAGPLLYTRYYLIALLQALDELHGQPALKSRDHYVLPLPILRPRGAPRRAIAGNDLTIATLVVHRRLLARLPELDAALLTQIRAHKETGLDEATWVMMAYAGWLRNRHYQWVLGRPRTFPRYSIGFTSFRTDDWNSGFLGCSVENFSACGLPPIPPGIIACFCRVGLRLNLTLSYYSHVCAPELAERLAQRIEYHLGVGL